MLWPPVVFANIGNFGGGMYHRLMTPLHIGNLLGYLQMKTSPPNQSFISPQEIAPLRPDCIVFHHTHTPANFNYIQDCKKYTDATIVYTIDDWVERVPKYSPHFKEVPSTAGKDIRTFLKYCDRLIVTNEVLANVYGNNKLEVSIIPNYLSYLLWGPLYINKKLVRMNSNKPRIGWAGALGHSADIAIVSEAFERIGDRVQWVFIDPGDLPDQFKKAGVEIHPPCHSKDFPAYLYSLNLDLALCPLVNNDFNRARSYLRVLENAACGYDILASDISTFKSCPVDKVLFTAEDWYKAINSKIDDFEKIKSEGERLKKWLWDTHKLEDHIDEYSKIFSPDREGFQPPKEVIEIDNIVDVIITSYNNKEVLERCVNSVIESLPKNETSVEVIIADDCSTSKEMQDYLSSINDKCTVIKSSKNQGYIRNIDSAISLHKNRDVITLNDDTVVNGDWIDRLRDFAYEGGENNRVASVTPLSNKATTNSYPNPNGSDISYKLTSFYDDIAKEINFPTVQLVTSIGFCTFIRRNALNDVGLFDYHAFGKCYGEENEWSVRASIRGWKHVAAHNTYVWHQDSATYGPEKQKLMEMNNAVLMTRCRQYFPTIEKWIQQSPLAPVKQIFDILSLEKTSLEDRTLYITHSVGGGVDTYLYDKLRFDCNAIVLRNDPNSGNIYIQFNNEEYFNLPVINSKQINLIYLSRLLAKFKVKKISIQSTIGYDYNFPIWIMNLCKLMDISYEIMLHDYYPICPRVKLTSEDFYCGEPDIHSCNECIMNKGSWIGQVEVSKWRNLYSDFLHGASKLMAPSYDAINRYKKYFDLDIQYEPHESDIVIEDFGRLPYNDGDEIKVAVIGYMSPEKGSYIVRDCAKYCEENNINMKFIVFGSLFDTKAGFIQPFESSSKLQILGNYEESKLYELISNNKCHISFFPAQWPETYSYTLSHAFRAGLLPVAFDIGAISERIKERNYGHLIPFSDRKNIDMIVNSLMKMVVSSNDIK